MRQMRKIILIATITIGVLCAGCGNGKDEVKTTKAETTSVQETETSIEKTTTIGQTTEVESTTLEEEENSKILEEKYKEILDKYYVALSESWDMSQLEENGLCYLCGYHENISEIGYTFIDVNNNGAEELLIGQRKAEGGYVGMFYALYTIVDDEVILVTNSGERDRYYLCKDNSIANESSSGAALSSYSYYKLDGESLELKEAVIYDGIYDEKNPWFYSTTGLEEKDYNPISEKRAQKEIDKYEYQKISYTPFTEY